MPFFFSFQQTRQEATNGQFATFGHDRYAPIPGAAPEGASAMHQASFAWREIARDRVILGKVLGEGEFGMVIKGDFTEDDGHVMPCAVKKLKRKLNQELIILSVQLQCDLATAFSEVMLFFT